MYLLLATAYQNLAHADSHDCRSGDTVPPACEIEVTNISITEFITVGDFCGISFNIGVSGADYTVKLCEPPAPGSSLSPIGRYISDEDFNGEISTDVNTFQCNSLPIDIVVKGNKVGATCAEIRYRYDGKGKPEKTVDSTEPEDKQLEGKQPPLISGDGVVLYAIKNDGSLVWYKDEGWQSGSGNWANGGNERVVASGSGQGSGWAAFKQVVSSGRIEP